MAVRILCAGDVHLGRSPSRLPADLEHQQRFSPRRALDNLVSLALSEDADAVVLTGDLVDQDNKMFEGYRALVEPLRELERRAVPVYAIAGNHDYDVLPRVAEELPNFHFLSADGQWDWAELRRGDTLLGRLLARSFTGRFMRSNPLEGLPELLPEDVPLIGVLHCDVDQPGSEYGPVRLSELLSCRVGTWLLGHIHRPQVLHRSPLVLYPGSLQAMDPGEDGQHGAALVEIDRQGNTHVTEIPLAPLRYQPLELDISAASGIEDVRGMLLAAPSKWIEGRAEQLAQVQAVALRLTFTGSCNFLGELDHLCRELIQEAPINYSDIDVFYEHACSVCVPKIDLEQTAQGEDPAALLAKRLLILRSKEPQQEYRRLLAAVDERLRPTEVHHHYVPLPSAERRLGESERREYLLRAGSYLLAELVKQRQYRT